MSLPILLSVFAGIMGLALAAALLLGQGDKRRARALSVITRDKPLGLKEESREKELARHRAEISRKLKEAGKEESKKKKDGVTIKALLEQAGFEHTPPLRFWLYSLLFSGVTFFFLSALKWPQAAVLFLTITAFAGIPKFYLKARAGRRQKKFLQEFPDALDSAVRLLQAGMPISEAIAMASREYTGPLKDEMTRIYENQKIGIPIGQAALETSKRIPLPEVHMFATALQIQSETGSSLSEVLSNLSTIIRARFKLKRKIKALSSEAKSSAAIIGCLPLVVAFGLYMVNPEYIGILFTTVKGKWLLAAAGTWMSFGILIMRQMINFRI